MIKKVLFLILIGIGVTGGASAWAETYRAAAACTPGERWTVSTTLPKAWVGIVTRFSSTKFNPFRDYNFAFLLKNRVRTPEAQAIGTYWMARSLYAIGLHHLAKTGFEQAFLLPESPEVQGVQLAALECLNRINREYSNLSLSKEVVSKLLNYPFQSLSVAHRSFFQEAAFVLLKSGRVETNDPRVKERLLSMTLGPGGYEPLARALLAVGQADVQGSVVELRRYFAVSAKAEVPYLKNFDDTAHLLLARNLYELKAYDQAIEEFRKVQPDSNYFPQALSDLSWAYLRKINYNEAVGTALGLQSGGMTRTFTPEAPLIVAISLVEVCHYPEALKQLKVFTKAYYPAYKWLHAWASNPQGQSKTPYELTLAYIKKQPGIPSKVATEWLRSPVFLANQKEINLLTDERKQGNIALSKLRVFPGLHTKPDLGGYSDFSNKLTRLMGELSYREKVLVDGINSALLQVNSRLMTEIADAADNSQLIEAEIFNAAGEDMIKKNARPDEYSGARKIAKEEKGAIWRWGKLPSGVDEGGEVWDDELGALKGDLTDQCPQKKRK